LTIGPMPRWAKVRLVHSNKARPATVCIFIETLLLSFVFLPGLEIRWTRNFCKMTFEN